jgi:HD superfamily phosphohydrolase
MFERRHSFRDPIHGFIRVSESERKIVSHMVFQRLRRISQLGTGHLVYHGAEHSRFGHSLGVMEVATRVFDRIKRRRPDLLQTDDWDRYEQLLRLAGLLHDVGHAPFSHASEELFPEGPSGKPLKHEDYTSAIILNSEIGEIIEHEFSNLGISARDVVNVFVDPSVLGVIGVLLEDIVAGELDADRMDYLARDSLYAGVSYGRFDLDRLLDTITAVEDDDRIHLAVDQDGRHALEAFLLARYYMFLQVYLHPTRRFYDFALTKVIQDVLQQTRGATTYPGPESWKDFVSLDDVWLNSRLPELSREGLWADCLFSRHHWKVIAEHASGTLDQPSGVDAGDWAAAQNYVCDRFQPSEVLTDDAKAKTFQRTNPGPYIGGTGEREERPRILIWNQGEKAATLVEETSGLVRELSKGRIRIRRLYACPESLDRVTSAWSEAASRYL